MMFVTAQRYKTESTAVHIDTFGRRSLLACCIDSSYKAISLSGFASRFSPKRIAAGAAGVRARRPERTASGQDIGVMSRQAA